MKTPTLEEIKEMYPEGCEISCATRDIDKIIVKHNDIVIDHDEKSFYLSKKNNNNSYFLYYTNGSTYTYAKITKPAPQESSVPKRYKDREVCGMDVIALAKHWNLDFNEGNILKYLLRNKGQDVEDMFKIADYAQRQSDYLIKQKQNNK